MDPKSADLERRLAALEAQVAIYQLVCGYGYAVDGCNGDAVGALFAEDATYAIDDVGVLAGRERLAAIATAPAHRALVERGCGHVSTLPYVVLDGDRASATCHTLVVQREEHGFVTGRLSASRLELSRDRSGTWRIDSRQNALLDGGDKGPALLARLTEPPARDGAE